MTAEPLAEFFESNPDQVLHEEIRDMIRAGAASHPRHLQTRLGPSELGHPCDRRMAYGILEIPKVRRSVDMLPSIMGVGGHNEMQLYAERANEALGRQRWWTETRVDITPWLSGSCDLYDADTATVIDYKFPGASRMTEYRKNGPTHQYRTQVHLYGRGFINMGMPVENVAIMFIPRAGYLTGSHFWSEPYDEQIAADAIAHHDRVTALIADLEVETHPERFAWIARSGPDCMFCNWFRPKPGSPFECGGPEEPTTTEGSNK